MGDKSRLCVACGRFIGGQVVQTDDGPVHDCGELLDEVGRLRAEHDHLHVKALKAFTEALALQHEVERLNLHTEQMKKLSVRRFDEVKRLREMVKSKIEGKRLLKAEHADTLEKLAEAQEHVNRMLRVPIPHVTDYTTRIGELEGQLAEAEAMVTRLTPTDYEEDLEAEVKWLRTLKDAIVAAHDEHLRTGDYAKLGMAAQDALLALEGSTPTDRNDAGYGPSYKGSE